MKVRHSLKSVKTRDKDSKLVRRKGRIYVINKKFFHINYIIVLESNVFLQGGGALAR